jgi:hypothetical protein
MEPVLDLAVFEHGLPKFYDCPCCVQVAQEKTAAILAG